MKLKSIYLKGYRSIDNQDGAKLDFGDITLLLGANGVGKSNLISFFSLMNYMMSGSLQAFIAERGFADSFLYRGSKISREIEASIEFEDDKAKDSYEFRLTYAAGDRLIFTEEKLSCHFKDKKNPWHTQLNPGVSESNLLDYVKRLDVPRKDMKTASVILDLLRSCKVFHFHDTSITAGLRRPGYIEDNRYLRHDGGNLAAFLFRLKDEPSTRVYYDKIVRYIQKAMPQFGDFELFPVRNYNILLNWRERHKGDYLMGPHQISDGSLRFMCLTTLLLQPKEFLPKVIVLDEPELGLHPSAIAYLAAMIKAASQQVQIILATQSPRLVDEFEPEQVVVVERQLDGQSTIFKRKNSEELEAWLEDYSLSELWEKNVLGGQP